jgi:hypothetical protein
MHDVTTARLEGIDVLLDAFPQVKLWVPWPSVTDERGDAGRGPSPTGGCSVRKPHEPHRRLYASRNGVLMAPAGRD